MRAIKDIAGYIHHYSGMERYMLWLFRNHRHPLLLNIVYHRIAPSIDSYEYMGVPVDVFEEHLKFIKDNFKVVNMTDGLDLVSEERSKATALSILTISTSVHGW